MSQVQLGALTLEPRRQLLAGGRPLPIGRKALDILSVLAEADGALVTKEELMAAVWPGLIVEENAIQVHVAALRKLLGEEATRLTTVRGLGYRLNSLVPANRSPSPPVRVARKPSVAILPLANLTGDPAKDYLAEGIAQELIATLSRATDLKVPSWTSCRYYKGRAADIRAIARQLGVETVVEGWVKAGEGRIRVNAQLIDAATGFHIWADSFDREAADLASLEDELANAIASALQACLGSFRRPTTSARALDLFLQARSLHERPSPESTETAIRLLEQALDLDDQFSRALGYMAMTLGSAFFIGLRGPEVLADIRSFAQRAIAADPLIWEGHTALASAALLSGDWQTAEEHTSNGDPCPVRTALFATMGHVEDALILSEHIMVLEPCSTAAVAVCATVHWMLGDSETALQRAARAISLGHPAGQMPIALVRAEATLAGGDGIAAAELLLEGLPPALADLGFRDVAVRVLSALAGTGSRDMALASLERFVRESRTRDVWQAPPLMGLVMQWFARLGALDSAFRTADRMIENWRTSGLAGQPNLMFIWTPGMARFREDPRFADLAERLGLLAYWRRYGPPDQPLPFLRADAPGPAVRA